LIAELEALVASNPLREGLRAQLMLALYRSGRQAESLEVYRDTRQTLVDQLGIEPGRRLQALHQAILAQDSSLDAPAMAPAEDDAARGVRGFVGRRPELKKLLEKLDSARSGQGAIALIAGEAGIGKTRLADELGALARERGFAVHWGRCWEAGGAPPYWPWVQSLRSYLGAADEARVRAHLATGAADVAQLLPELEHLAPDARPAPPSGETDGDRFRMFEAVASYLAAAAAGQPQLLVLDDLHAADAPSLLLLQFFARQRACTRLLIVGTYRDAELDDRDPVRAALLQVAREPDTLSLVLEGLGVAEVNRYVEIITEATPPSGFGQALHDRTEGNPLFVGEIVRLLAGPEGLDDEGSLAASQSVIPQTVRDVIARRIDTLSPGCTETLETASVVGREFTIGLLERVTGRSPEELLHILDEAVRARVVVEDRVGPATCRFAHVLIRDTLYDQLASASRLRLHQQVGEALEALHGQDGERLAELAHHFLKAVPLGDARRGVDYAERAGDRAAGMLAFEEAARHFEAALGAMQVSSSTEPGRRCDSLLRLGDAHARAGAEDEAKRAFRAAAEIAAELGLREEAARAALGYGGRFLWTRAATDEQLVPLLISALRGLRPGDDALRARLLARLAGATRVSGAAQRGELETSGGESAISAGREGVEVARRVGEPATLAYALEGYLLALWGPGTAQTRIDLAAEIIELTEQFGDRERLFAGHENRLHSSLELGDMATVRHELGEMTHLANAMRQPAQLWMLAATRGMVALSDGDLELAEQSIEAAFAFGRRALHWNADVTHELQNFMLRRAQGRVDEATAGLRRAADDYPDYTILRCALANLESLLGHDDGARVLLNSLAEDDFRRMRQDDSWVLGMTLLAEVCAGLGDAERATALYGHLTPYADSIAVGAPDAALGSVARPLGVLAQTMGDEAAAEAHFLAALDVNERIGADPSLADTQREYARMLAQRGRPGDAERARELATRASTIFKAIRTARGSATRAQSV
jgi:tetratricopeptide (TPR) repeat protein